MHGRWRVKGSMKSLKIKKYLAINLPLPLKNQTSFFIFSTNMFFNLPQIAVVSSNSCISSNEYIKIIFICYAMYLMTYIGSWSYLFWKFLRASILVLPYLVFESLIIEKWWSSHLSFISRSKWSSLKCLN